VGVALIGLAAWLLSGSIVENRQWGFKADRRVQVTQVLVNTVSEVLNQEFGALRDLCSGPPSRFVSQPIDGRCLASDGSFNEGTETQVNPLVPRLFQVRRDWTGAYSNSGKVCLDLVQCQPLAGGRLLEFTIRVYWKDPAAQKPYLSHQMRARKARS
jgi:hypothetical protein